MTQPLPDPRSSLSHFTAQEVQHYDSRIPSLVPGYAVLHYGGAALLGQWLPDGARVLAGTLPPPSAARNVVAA